MLKTIRLRNKEAIFVPSGSSKFLRPASAESTSCPNGCVDGDKLGPPIFLKFQYVNKQDVLILINTVCIIKIFKEIDAITFLLTEVFLVTSKHRINFIYRCLPENINKTFALINVTKSVFQLISLVMSQNMSIDLRNLGPHL